MYSVFPYQQPQIDQAKSAINKHSLGQLQVAVSADQEVLKRILNSTFSYNSYIEKSILKFTDSLIKGEYIHNSPVGDFLESELDKIYNPELSLTQAEQDAFAAFGRLNHGKEDDLDATDLEIHGTDVIGAAEEPASSEASSTVISEKEELINQYGQTTYQKYLDTLDLRATKDQSSETKSFEKAILLNYFSDALRKHHIISTKNPEIKSCETPSGSWNYAADSFVGFHTLGVNSDAFSASKNSTALLGVIGDGVTHAFSTEELNGHSPIDVVKFYKDTCDANLRRFGGHNIARTVTNAISNFDFDSFHGSTKVKEEKPTNLQPYTSVIKALKKIANDTKFKADGESDLGILEQYSNYLEAKGKTEEKSKLTEILNDNKARLIFTALAPIIFIQDKVGEELKKTYKDFPETLLANMTLNYSLELEDKIVQVQIGDADTACYDAKGNKIDPEFNFTINAPIELAMERSQLAALLYPSPNSDFSLFPALDTVVKIYDKKDVDKIAQVSDGATEDSNTKTLPKTLPTNIKDAFSELAAVVPLHKGKKDYDDKTIMLFQKAS